jgi:hypothetical protein
MERFMEERIIQMYGSTSTMLNEVKRDYPEPYVQRAAREAEDLLQEIRMEGEIIHHKLYEMNRNVTSAARQYIEDEEKFKRLIQNKQVKFSFQGRLNSFLNGVSETISGEASKPKSPIEKMVSLFNGIQEVSLGVRLRKFRDDEMIGMYLELLENGSAEKQQFARQQLTEINEAFIQIARSQTAYQFYSKYSNLPYMEEVQLDAEQARLELAGLGVAEKWYASDVSLRSHSAGSPLDSCLYNPLKSDRSFMPELDVLRFFLQIGSNNEWFQEKLRSQYDKIERVSIAADKWRIEIEATLEECNQSIPIENIEIMQQFLKDSNLYTGEVTGEYSLELLTAVQQYQILYNESEAAIQLQYTSEIDGRIDNKLMNLIYMERGLIEQTSAELDMCYAPKSLEDTRNGFQKSMDSFGEIGSGIMVGAEDRSDKALDSPGDFLNYITMGIPKGMYDAAVERTEKRKDSRYDYADYISLGLAGTIKGVIDPEEGAYSAEHWMNSFGLASMIAGGNLIKQPSRFKSRNDIELPKQKETTAGIDKKEIAEIKVPDLDEVKPLKGEKLLEREAAEGMGNLKDLPSIIERVKEIRSQLPSSLKKSGNFGYAEVDIQGVNNNEFFAHSSVNQATDKGVLPEMSLKPQGEAAFNAKKVDPDNARIDTPEAYLRDYDTEYKILNDIASHLGDNKNAKGTINLFTERLTCQSCADVILEFRRRYPNITVNILTNDGKVVK